MQSYKHERGSLVHFSSSFSSVVARRTKCSRQPRSCLWLCQIFIDVKIIFTDRLSNKPFLIWLLTTTPNLKYVATLHCNLLLIGCFLKLMFRKVAWQYMQGMVGLLITSLLQIYQRIFQRKHFVNRSRFDRIMAMRLWPHFFRHTPYT